MMSRRDNAVSSGVSPPAPTRRVGSTKRHTPDPSRDNGRANPAGSPVVAMPSWCGKCDEGNRLRLDDQERPYRCPDCHPLADRAQEAI